MTTSRAPGAVNLAAVLAATRATGVPLAGHRIVIFGMGTAGAGIADQLTAAMVAEGVPEAEARRRFWAVDRQGLLTRDMTALSDLQRRYARDPAEVADWRRDGRRGKHAVPGASPPAPLPARPVPHPARESLVPLDLPGQAHSRDGILHGNGRRAGLQPLIAALDRDGGQVGDVGHGVRPRLFGKPVDNENGSGRPLLR